MKLAEANAQVKAVTHFSLKSRVLPKELNEDITSSSSDLEDGEEEDEEMDSPVVTSCPVIAKIRKLLRGVIQTRQHQSTRQRDPNALSQHQEALSKLISQPGQSGRRPPVPAPTQGERGQALAAQQRRAKKTRGAAPRTSKSTQPAVAPIPSGVAPVPSIPPEYPEEQQIFNYGLPLVTDTASIERDHSDDEGENNGNFVHERDTSDGDGDTTLRAPPNLEMLQNLALNDEPASLDPRRPGSVWPLGSGANTESMLDLLNVPDIPCYDFQAPFSTPHQALLFAVPHQAGAAGTNFNNLMRPQTGILSQESFFTSGTYAAPASHTQTVQHAPGSEPEPSWEPDPLPPNSTMYTSNAQVQLMFTVYRAQSGALIFTGLDHVIRAIVSNINGLRLDLRIYGKSAELPTGHPTLLPAERLVVCNAQSLLTEQLLTENAFLDKSILKLWAHRAYQQAHLAAQIPSGMNPAQLLPSDLAVKSIKAAASIVRNQLKQLCEERVPWLYELNPPESLPEEEK
ncbi:hypothetical protein DXG01_007602, partial [Tephrocybe rancida]